MTFWHALLAGATLLAGVASVETASAQPSLAAQPPVAAERPLTAQPPAPPARPPNEAATDGLVQARYMVEAVSFKTDNETGLDWPGSDEIIVRFVVGEKEIFSGKYGDVDAGETHVMRRWQTCIYPALDPDGLHNHTWICDRRGGAGPVNFKITLYEYDGLFREFLQNPTGFCISGGSDLLGGCEERGTTGIGTASVAYTEDQLAAMMPTSGTSVTKIIPIGSGYKVTIRLTRMRGLLVPPVGEEGPLSPMEPTQPCVPGPGPPCP